MQRFGHGPRYGDRLPGIQLTVTARSPTGAASGAARDSFVTHEQFVTYPKQNAAKHDDVAGRGNGFVDVFDTDGHLLRRFTSRGPLNSPWAVTRASFAFGRFSGRILIGNFGNGRINAFDNHGQFAGELEDPQGNPVVIDGL